MAIGLGKKIASIRALEKLSQGAFAQLVGVKLATLRNYEQERTDLPAKELLKIVDHPRFKKYASWLIDEGGAPFEEWQMVREPATPYSSIETDDPELSAMLSKLDDARRKAAREHIEYLLQKQKTEEGSNTK